MSATILEAIGEQLGRISARGSFAARRTSAVDDLHIRVTGLGKLKFPISEVQAQRLVRIGRPARHGLGERTILDKRVRDTSEIPKSRLKIDERGWSRTLEPTLDALRADLGTPAGYRLRAELHNMLIYAPGQFFVRHQDSEKADDMMGTLVVTLPSSFKGGAIVVEHQGECAMFGGSKRGLLFIAFYADCHHEVRPVRSGHRIVLTYNLMRVEDPAATAGLEKAAVEDADAIAARLREYFDTPLPPRTWQRDTTSRELPKRLVYLLDHQYTERGLSWRRLKGQDHARVDVLRAVAESAGYEMVLALADVQETWGCEPEDWDEPFSRGFDDDEEEDQSSFGETPDVTDGYILGELQDRSITLQTWLDQSGEKAEPIATRVSDEEVCSTTPSSALDPYASEHEGYMGNYGNTVDRWYRRGAIVLWPRERAFAVRAEASPAWALESLSRQIRAGGLREAQENAAALLPFWNTVARAQEQRRLFGKALRVAEGLDVPALAVSLLRPFPVEGIAVGQAKGLVKLVRRYGEGFLLALLAEWSAESRKGLGSGERDRLRWLGSLGELSSALRAADESLGTVVARRLLHDQWSWLQDEASEHRAIPTPTRRDQALASLADAVLGCLRSASAVEAFDLRDVALSFLCADENEQLLGCLLRVLRLGASTVVASERDVVGLAALAEHCDLRLQALLDSPVRSRDDWSWSWFSGCPCKLCGTLAAFLGSRENTRLEWPLAKPGRGHVHGQLDKHELPVSHETRRSGRPFALVLTKSKTLFEREAALRRTWQADRDWLLEMTSGGTPKRATVGETTLKEAP